MSWERSTHVLAVRLDNLGDILMTTPALRALKESVPGRRVTLLASRAGARVARHIPEIDSAIGYDAPWMKHASASPAVDLEMCRQLADAHFDAAVIFTVYSQSALPAALLCHLAGIPLRLAHSRENPYHLLTDWVRDPEPGEGVRHEVRRQLDLVAAVGARTGNERLSFRVGKAARRRARARMEAAGIDAARPYVVVHPGATAASRRWSAQRFAACARRLATERDLQVAVTGDASEAGLVGEVCAGAGPRARGLAGVLALDEFGAAIAGASIVVSNNTGTVHLAAAIGTPVVDLYALTNPQHTPWMVEHRLLSRDVPCRNCYKSVCPRGTNECLDVSVEDVFAAACELHEAQRLRAAA
jgi:lipopolysaccharide heptosyltransferase II